MADHTPVIDITDVRMNLISVPELIEKFEAVPSGELHLMLLDFFDKNKENNVSSALMVTLFGRLKNKYKAPLSRSEKKKAEIQNPEDRLGFSFPYDPVKTKELRLKPSVELMVSLIDFFDQSKSKEEYMVLAKEIFHRMRYQFEAPPAE